MSIASLLTIGALLIIVCLLPISTLLLGIACRLGVGTLFIAARLGRGSAVAITIQEKEQAG